MWYVDSDNVIHIEGLRNAVTFSYVNNAVITAILYKLPAFNPDVSGVAVDKGSGKVGIPCEGHGLVSGNTIRIERSSNYNNAFDLTVATSTDELVITATFVAETFTGEEFIYEALVGSAASPITFDYVDASNGEYIGKFPYTAPLRQGESYMMCIKEVSGSEQVLAKIVAEAGFQGM